MYHRAILLLVVYERTDDKHDRAENVVNVFVIVKHIVNDSGEDF